MAPRHRPGPDDAHRSRLIVLRGLATGVDVHDIAGELRELHPKNDTFPGEVFLELTLDVLELGAFSRDDPIELETLMQLLAPDVQIRARHDHRKIRYTLLSAPAWRGGLAPDLLDEVVHWQTDDYWLFALYALVAYIRATADHNQTSIADVCEQLADRHDIDLDAP